jgi:methylase of polypeptide subunit release factors
VEYHRADLAVGQKLLKMLLGSGLLEQRNGEVRSPFYLNIVNDMLLICDDLSLGRGAVMGAGLTTMMLCEAAHPRRRLNSLLDLGCGAGTIALQFASHVDAATGSDVNPRAIQMANVNRMLNPMPNDCAVRFLVSDLFGELAEDKFDLIVAQPPFVPRFPEAAPATFLFGGHRGDELPLKLITQVPDHLGSAGRAVLLIEWPIVDDKPVEQLIRENPWSPRI